MAWTFYLTPGTTKVRVCVASLCALLLAATLLCCQPDTVLGWCDTQTTKKLLTTCATLAGTSFPAAERERLGLRGLLPPRVIDMQVQVSRQ